MSLTAAFRHKKTKHLRRGSMRLASAMIYAAAIVLPGAAEASASDDASGMTSVIQVLKDHRFQALDTFYVASQKAYREGRITDVELLRRFSPFDVGGLSLDQDLDLWNAQYPQSYAAHLARGMHLMNQALIFGARSYKPDVKVRAQVREDFQLARVELERSLKLDDKPIVSYAYLILDSAYQDPASPIWQGLRIVLAQTYDFRIPALDELAKYLKAANQLAPDNYIARSAYLRSIRTRWGLSTKDHLLNRTEDDWFVDECRAAHLSTDQIKGLNGEIEYAMVPFRVSSSGLSVVGQAYRTYLDGLGGSADLIDAHERAYALMRVAMGQAEKSDFHGALASINQAISTRDDLPRLWALRSYYLGQLKDPAWVAAAETASDLGDAWAEYRFGAYLLGQPKNPGDAERGRKLEASGIEAGYKPQ